VAFSRITKIRYIIFSLLAVLLLRSGPAAGSEAIREATEILERWTSFHWGRDCLVWIVHYPEELVDPWVESEAARGGMSEGEKEEYRRAFVSELRISDTEPFLVTIYAFGPRPLDFGGFASSVRLVTKNGDAVPPLSYEGKFDQPVSGIVQGLVFFPKQRDKEFSVAMRRLGVVEEQLFSFGGEGAGSTPVASLPPEKEKEVVVVELPPAPRKEPPKPKPVNEPEPPKMLPPPPVPAQPVELAELQPRPAPEPVRPEPPEEPKKNVIFISRDKTLELFIGHWIAGDTKAMYGLLSSATKTLLNEDEFRRQVNATGLRLSLRDGYKVQWLDGDRAKVITAQKMLVFRTLRSKSLSMVKEDKIWKVTW
jgi:hypothetical protein